MGSPEDSSWAFDCPLIEGFCWSPPRCEAPQLPNNIEVSGGSSAEFCFAKEPGSNKRVRSSTCQPSSKACKEKMRRDKLNERFLELGSVLEPGKTPKMDKAAILNDAIRVVTDLRNEAQKLKESNEGLQEKIKELKAEKNEIRDEKQRLKAEKDSLEQQIKILNSRPSVVTHQPVIPTAAAFMPPGQAAGASRQKLMVPVIGYPGFPMWQFMPPSDVDTTQDQESCPPVA